LGLKHYFHRGEQGGFIAFFSVIPERDVLIILEINSLSEDIDISRLLPLMKRFGYI
jgi:hypothetical protein